MNFLTARVPFSSVGLDFSPETLLDVGEWVVVGEQHLPEQRDVGDGKAQGVDLREAFFVRERRHVHAELIKGRVDAAGPAKGNSLENHRLIASTVRQCFLKKYRDCTGSMCCHKTCLSPA